MQATWQMLVDGARNGDSRSISILYEQSYKPVYYTIKSMVSDEDTALDLTQDTFVKAFSTLNMLGDPNKFTAWVKVIGRNLTLNYLKKKKPVMFSEITPKGAEEEYELPFEDTNTGNSPEAVMDQQETARLIREILGTLSDSQRLAVGMFYYEGMSIKQIAAQTGMSESSVKVHLHNGRKRIEEKVRELEKQGTKLYSLAPMGFLLWLLRSQSTLFDRITDPSCANVLGKLSAVGKNVIYQGQNTAPQTYGTQKPAEYNARGMKNQIPQGNMENPYNPASYTNTVNYRTAAQTAAKAGAGKAAGATAATAGKTAAGAAAGTAGKIAAATAVKTAAGIGAGKVAAIVAASVIGTAAVGTAAVVGVQAVNHASTADESSSIVEEYSEADGQDSSLIVLDDGSSVAYDSSENSEMDSAMVQDDLSASSDIPDANAILSQEFTLMVSQNYEEAATLMEENRDVLWDMYIAGGYTGIADSFSAREEAYLDSEAYIYFVPGTGSITDLTDVETSDILGVAFMPSDESLSSYTYMRLVSVSDNQLHCLTLTTPSADRSEYKRFDLLEGTLAGNELVDVTWYFTSNVEVSCQKYVCDEMSLSGVSYTNDGVTRTAYTFNGRVVESGTRSQGECDYSFAELIATRQESDYIVYCPFYYKDGVLDFDAMEANGGVYYSYGLDDLDEFALSPNYNFAVDTSDNNRLYFHKTVDGEMTYGIWPTQDYEHMWMIEDTLSDLWMKMDEHVIR